MFLDRLIPVDKGDRRAVAWSFAYFFCLLSSYYVLRPVRDEMAIEAGVRNMQWLFTGTFLVMLAAVPVFGWLSSRFARRKMLPLVYGFFIADLLIFFVLLKIAGAPRAIGAAFFVWVSVFNLFAVSVFWSFMADLFSSSRAKQWFGVIAAGGSLGAIAGPSLTAALAPALGPVNLLPISALLLLAAIFCIYRLSAWAVWAGVTTGVLTASAGAAASTGAPIGGGILGGLRLLGRSPFLLGICGYIVLYTTLSTFLYFDQARIVQQAIAAPAERTRLFALMDLAVNSLTLVGQLFFTGRVVSRFGLPVALALIPALTIAGFAWLALAPTLAVLVGFQIVRRAGDFAVARPAREMLFTLVNREARYKSKNVIDTLVYRGGDAASGWLVTGLKAAGASIALTAWIAVPIAVLWLISGWVLGRTAQATAQTPRGPPDPARRMPYAARSMTGKTSATG